MFNRNRRDGSMQMGQRPIVVFDRIAEQKGYKITPASRYQDMNQHFDRILQKDGKQYKVQIKSKKKIKRSDDDAQDSLIWIQYQCCGGGKGWIYGKADYIAFQMTQSFMLVNRQDLLRIADSQVNKQQFVNRSQDALNKLYLRLDRSQCPYRVTQKQLRQKVMAGDNQFRKCHSGLLSIIKIDAIKDPQNKARINMWPK